MQIQWYPGHMTKARRAMQEDLKLVDLVMELTDARAPLAGRNPDIDKLAAGKARMIFLNKADLADDQATLAWMDYFRKKGITPIRLDERKNAMKKEYDELNDMLFEQYELTKHEAEALNIQIDDMSEAKRRLHEIKVAIKGLGSINVGAIEEYKEVSERYTFLKEQIGDVEKSKNELMKIIEDLTASMSEKFLTQFNKINAEFKVCFADFFGGGKGELLLEQPDNCLESPIEIRIQPPGKSVQNINLFSGGEKSLAAMALLFSVLKVQPAPFCIYDEVEAALDDVNVERFAKYMRKMTDKTQFISITHRRGTMEEADVLYGVTMQEKGVSKLIELQTAELAAKMGLE